VPWLPALGPLSLLAEPGCIVGHADQIMHNSEQDQGGLGGFIGRTLESRNVLNVRLAILLKNQKGQVPKILAPACSALPRVAYLDRKPSVPHLSKDRHGPAFTNGWMERAYG
jgi:hypothetical protein